MPRSSEERPLRTQRSMGSVQQRPRAHDRSMPPPPLPRAGRERAPSSTSNYASHASRSRAPSSAASDSSASSVITTSSSGSFLDRMRQKYPAPSSSVSSFEVEREPSESGKGHSYSKDKENGESVQPFPSLEHVCRQTSLPHLANADYRQDPEPVANDFASYSAYGQAIWNRVATAASTWTWPGTNANGITTGCMCSLSRI